MTTPRRALIIGAGIGGLAAGIALGSRGWTVDIAETKQVNGTVGVGLNNPANALRALRPLGIYDQVANKGYVYQGIRRYDETGRHIATFEPVNPPDIPSRFP
jgi:2-polyprenyl-6-methoxyphenol hydroxylase-like FAD-dependent oxidoreductase